MKYAFFPGCSLQSTAKEYKESVQAVAKALDIELTEVPGWNCCGAIDAIYTFKPLYSLALAARNLALAEKMQMDVATPCSACYFTLSRTNKILKEDAATKSKIDEALKTAGLNYNGGVKVRHFAEALLSDVGLQKIRERVKAPLATLKVAAYYGCFMVRPPNICSFDKPERPTRLDELAEALGASKVDYYGKTRCCGQSLGITDEEAMLKMSKDILLNAKNAGADCMMTACPMCHFNLDARQKDIESHFSVRINLPVLHFTQLVGLAFGVQPRQVGLQRNCVSPRKILSKRV
ncbi:MAG: CoB--CoM heterodisulfide reductase iron-sulfur subunit B family protein [Candidatus Bathyarchaeia archaeon]